MYSRRWLIATLAVSGLLGGCSQFNTNLTTQTSSSVLTFLSPASVTAGGVSSTGLAVTANGAGFVSGAIIIWNLGPNQIQLTTTFVSSNQLTATVPASNFASAGTIQVAVQIPGSAVSGSSGTTATTTTEVSNRVNFSIGAAAGPAPAIASVSAPSTSLSSTPYCQSNGFPLTVNGSNFATDSVVNWNGLPRVTTFGSSALLTAAILATDTAFPGVARISVSNAAGTSNTATFTTTTPATNLQGPIITSLSPTTATAGTSAATFTLTVTGSSFVPCSVVRWDGSDKTTAYVSATQLDATIPAADVFTAGPGGTTPRTVQVTAFTLTPGGGTSGAITFTINP